MSGQVTASKAEQFFNCARSLAAPRDPEDDDADTTRRDYGVRFHKAMHVRAMQHLEDSVFDAEPLDEEMRAHVGAAWGVVKAELLDKGWGILDAERPRAYHVASDRARFTTLDEETHTYDLEFGEVGGTPDLVLCRGSDALVIDYKTGDSGTWHTPEAVPQMRFLAALTGANRVGILHTPPGVPPSLYLGEVKTDACEREILTAYVRLGEGSMRPGAWCRHCPSRSSCPANQGEMLARAESLLPAGIAATALASPPDLGRMHMLLLEFERVAKRAREEIRAAVERGEVITRPDGKVLTLVDEPRENLSKAALVRALGREEAERRIEAMRAEGLVETSTITKMVAK
jgi:hypothetical protein